MELRDYQHETILRLFKAIRAGKRRPVVQAPTGAGKTVIGGEIIRRAREKGKRGLFCVPALSLIDQTVERFEAQGIHDVGVVQSMHWMTDASQPIQVCSVQTLARRGIPEADFAIIDEAHVRFGLYDKWFNDPAWSDRPIIGLTATPWAKGMGKIWDDLIIGTTTAELIDRGHLSKFRAFACAHPDLSEVKTVAGDYDLKGLSAAMDKPVLVADIVSTWLEKGENRPTLCFCVDRLHAKSVQEQFEKAGVATGYVDAYSTLEERAALAKRFADGDLKVICNVGVLTTGVDWDVRCVILARPTKSEILYTQIVGRGLRTAENKDCCIILDHSDTTLRLGFVTDIHHNALDTGEKNKNRTNNKPLPKECPQCHALRPPRMLVCDACGFKVEPKNKVHTELGELMELEAARGSMHANGAQQIDKEAFYRELLGYAIQRGFKDGWAFYAYQDKFHMKPASYFAREPDFDISPGTLSWIRSRNIAKAKAREKLEGRGRFYV